MVSCLKLFEEFYLTRRLRLIYRRTCTHIYAYDVVLKIQILNQAQALFMSSPVFHLSQSSGKSPARKLGTSRFCFFPDFLHARVRYFDSEYSSRLAEAARDDFGKLI